MVSPNNENQVLGAAEFDRLWHAVYGSPAWGVKHGHGSFLTLEFGQPELVIREPTSVPEGASEKMRARCAQRLVTVTGEWHLWIYCCNWQVTLNDTFVAHSESPDDKIALAASSLDGQKLVSVNHDPGVGAWAFTFDLGGTLRTWPYEGEPSFEQWYLFERTTGQVLSVRADDYASYGSGNLRPEDETWIPLWVVSR
jgi:hypothetical protein